MRHVAGPPLSEVAKILQQLAAATEEGDGHLVWQHWMLSAEAALANPQAGTSWETTTRRSRIVRTLRTDSIAVPFWQFSDFPSTNTLPTQSKKPIQQPKISKALPPIPPSRP